MIPQSARRFITALTAVVIGTVVLAGGANCTMDAWGFCPAGWGVTVWSEHDRRLTPQGRRKVGEQIAPSRW